MYSIVFPSSSFVSFTVELSHLPTVSSTSTLLPTLKSFQSSSSLPPFLGHLPSIFDSIRIIVEPALNWKLPSSMLFCISASSCHSTLPSSLSSPFASGSVAGIQILISGFPFVSSEAASLLAAGSTSRESAASVSFSASFSAPPSSSAALPSGAEGVVVSMPPGFTSVLPTFAIASFITSSIVSAGAYSLTIAVLWSGSPSFWHSNRTRTMGCFTSFTSGSRRPALKLRATRSTRGPPPYHPSKRS
mmetsp:Transcript_36671/g.70687  ORF Transcript_36671/g.70687 Transcript_36671/m.70687 type:complete len:246 (+) Transcript_36671:2127-2864(+)